MTRREIFRAVVIGLAAVALGVALAQATIPGSTGLVSACYDKKFGFLRVIDTEAGAKCFGYENGLQFPATFGHAFIKLSSPSGVTLDASNRTETVKLSLPAGKYVIVGKGLVQNQQATSATVACDLYHDFTPLDTSDASLPAASIIQTNSTATMAFNAVVDLSAGGGDLSLQCISTDATPGAFVIGSFRLSAIQVGAITGP